MQRRAGDEEGRKGGSLKTQWMFARPPVGKELDEYPDQGEEANARRPARAPVEKIPRTCGSTPRGFRSEGRGIPDYQTPRAGSIQVRNQKKKRRGLGTSDRGIGFTPNENREPREN